MCGVCSPALQSSRESLTPPAFQALSPCELLDHCLLPAPAVGLRVDVANAVLPSAAWSARYTPTQEKSLLLEGHIPGLVHEQPGCALPGISATAGDEVLSGEL